MSPSEAEMERRRAAYYTHVAQQIALEGFYVQAVFGGSRPFAYTVGLSVDRFAHPEMIVVGLSLDNCTQLLVNAVGLIKESGAPLSVDTRISGLANLDCILKPITSTTLVENMGMAHSYWEANESGVMTAFQLHWADPNNLFEWEEGFDPQFIGFQSLD